MFQSSGIEGPRDLWRGTSNIEEFDSEPMPKSVFKTVHECNTYIRT